jgi:hypothetical protein
VFSTDDEDAEANAGGVVTRTRIGAASVLVLAATGAIVIVLGVLPGAFLHFAHDASSFL